jgi:hypothetical protein
MFRSQGERLALRPRVSARNTSRSTRRGVDREFSKSCGRSPQDVLLISQGIVRAGIEKAQREEKEAAMRRLENRANEPKTRISPFCANEPKTWTSPIRANEPRTRNRGFEQTNPGLDHRPFEQTNPEPSQLQSEQTKPPAGMTVKDTHLSQDVNSQNEPICRNDRKRHAPIPGWENSQNEPICRNGSNRQPTRRGATGRSLAQPEAGVATRWLLSAFQVPQHRSDRFSARWDDECVRDLRTIR